MYGLSVLQYVMFTSDLKSSFSHDMKIHA